MAFNIFTDSDTHYLCDIYKIAKLIRKHRKAARMIGKQKKLLVSLAKRNAKLQKDNNFLQNELAKGRNKHEVNEKREKEIIKMQIELINKDGEIKALKWALQNLRN